MLLLCEGWRGKGQGKQLIMLHCKDKLLPGRLQQPYQSCRMTAESRCTPWEDNFCSSSKKAARVKCAAATLVGQLFIPSKHPWGALHHPEDHPKRCFEAYSEFLLSNMRQRLEIAAVFNAAPQCFIEFGFRALGLGRSSASITLPHHSTARKSFFLMYPLCSFV